MIDLSTPTLDPEELPPRGARILVALSGGVDSSVAAALLHEAGYDVFGVTLHLWDAQGDQMVGRCCSAADQADARRTCDHLGIAHYVIDERESFQSSVVAPFVEDYLSGRTPSPCVHCNREVKLEKLVALAHSLGASHVATGHYARLLPGDGGRVALQRGRDHNKDQSYFLFGLNQGVLKHLVFPLGGMEKDETRGHAMRLGLPNANKPDSQELCFVPDGNVKGFIDKHRDPQHRPAENLESRPKTGSVVDSRGNVLGHHDGIESFTVGQRRGLGLGGGPPRYVLRIVPEDQTVVVGDDQDLLADTLSACDAVWVEKPTETRFRGQVRIRYRHDPAEAWVRVTANGFEAEFMEPQRAITPGQASVVYDGEKVLGGGFITTKEASHVSG